MTIIELRSDDIFNEHAMIRIKTTATSTQALNHTIKIILLNTEMQPLFLCTDGLNGTQKNQPRYYKNS